MGTNYYAVHTPCSHCDVAPDDIHIGKSSMGWAFSLHTGHGDLIDLESWREYLEKDSVTIHDEYGDEIGLDELINIITKRHRKCTEKEHTQNYLLAETMKPHCSYDKSTGLLRHLSPEYGETYDYAAYEFI